MKKTKNFNISVPELGDKPDITQVSNAIQDLEDALAGTIEIMNAEIQGTALTLTSRARTTQRTKYYDGMAIKFVAPIQINPNALTTVTVDGLSQQTLEIPYLVNAGDSVDIVYNSDKFAGTIAAIQRSNAIDSSSDITVATSLAVKTAYYKGESALQNAIVAQNTANAANSNAASKVSKSGDTMTGTLIIESQEDHKLIIKSTSDNKENYILGRDASGNSLFYVGKGSISNNDISMYNYRNNKGIALTDLGVVFTGEPYAGNYRVYHEGYKPTARDVGAFRYVQMFTNVPKTFNGVTQVPNNSSDWADVGGGSQHFILQSTTDDTYADNAYVGQIAWGYTANNPRIAIRCKNPGIDGRWELLARMRDLREHCPYRVGDILTTTLPDNPAVTWVGTTWQKIEGKYLKGTSGINNAKQIGGSNTKTLSVANMPAHNHSATQAPHLHTQPAHTHTYNASATESGGGYSGYGRDYPVLTRTTSSAGGENTGSAQPVITIENTGSGTPFNIEPEYYLVNFWLRLS